MMPQVYFQDTDRATQLSHLRAIIAAKASGRPLELTLRNEDGSIWTSMRPQDHPGVLAELVSELPHNRQLLAAKIHTARDGSLVIDTFVFGEPTAFNPSDPKQAERMRAIVEYVATARLPYSAEEVRAQCGRCSAEYVQTVTPLRFCKHLELWKKLAGTDGTDVVLETESDPSLSRIVVAVANATTRRMMERIARRLAHSKINIHRAYLDLVQESASESMTILGFVVRAPGGGPIDPAGAMWKEIERDLRRNKWVDHRALKLAYANPDLGTERAEVINALCDLTHQVLVKQNAYAFNLDRIHRLAHRNLTQSLAIAQLFLDRFDPAAPMSAEDLDRRSRELEQNIASTVDLEDARVLLRRMLDAVHATLRTNAFVAERFALSMRIDPAFMATNERPELPFGVFFVHGRSFNGFHVRFRDIARGGLRAIRTVSDEQHAIECERLYDEAYNLAFAQQLKNKDIPEGGAKAAILLDPYARIDRSVKAFVDALLDLITPVPKTRSRVIDRLGREELLYLGPDENITPEFIVWIANRAKVRGYPLSTALMSSKPGAGINHKEYGVTSEGVNVFLEVGLRAMGIDPRKQKFTVKITGGPDGDVGGNILRILHRDYGENARVVGIADGSGSGEDPDGFQWPELLRLFNEAKPIAEFSPGRLGPRGRVTPLSAPDGVHLRNTLHNRVVADAFLPCGGRPNAIHRGNWREFLRADGRPTSMLIVEGANLFLTADARDELSDLGVTIFKDSSANKCGVITSSYEIISNMMLSEEEFLAIKPVFVEQLLEKLRDLARREVELLVRLRRHHPQVPLPQQSTRLSRVMIRTADAIEEAIERLPAEDRAVMDHLIREHVPPILLQKAGDRLFSKVPASYRRWIIAKSLAARIVYREGFEHIDSMPMAAIADFAVRYLKKEEARRQLIEAVEAGRNFDRTALVKELRSAGILASLGAD